MTRNSAHENVDKWMNEDMPGKVSKWHYGLQELHRDVDKIFDSLDQEICINCSYASEGDDDELIHCDELGIEMSKTFGCVYFQEKEKK